MATTSATGDRESVHLNVISPSSPPICFRDIPISTSIAILKQKIYQASPTHPAPNLQRLIYRGHVLIQSERSLKEIFSQDVINANETLSIHLITPPTQQQTDAPATSQIRPPHPASEQQIRQSPPHVQQVTFSATFNGQPGHVQFPQQTAAAAPGSLGALRPQTEGQTSPQAPHQEQISASQPQTGGQAPIHPQLQAHLNAVQAQAHALFTNQLAALQQHPAFAARLPAMGTNGQIPAIPQPSLQPQDARQNSHPLPTYRTPQQSPQSFPNNHPNSLGGGRQVPINPFRPSDSPQQPEVIHPNSHTPPSQQNVDGRSQATPLTQTFGHTGAGRSQIPSGHYTAPFATPMPQYPPISQFNPDMDERRSTPPALYLLSSPTGPQALLVSPSGLFSTPWLMPQPIATAPAVSLSLRQMDAGFPIGRRTFASASAPVASPTSTTTPQNQPQATGEYVQNPPGFDNANPVVNNPEQRDVGRLAAQISSHIWMLVRLFGFIWFFSHGASTSRTIMLCVVGTLVFFGHVGLFQGLWQRVRTRLEEILHHGTPAQAHQPNSNNRASSSSTGPSTTPEQTAERLLAERRMLEGNALRQAFRRCERAAMLFFGSLAPGLAERHIQARNEAEAARQRENQEREVREKREEEARKSAAALPLESNDMNEESRPSSGEQRREAPAQASFIEV